MRGLELLGQELIEKLHSEQKARKASGELGHFPKVSTT